MIHPGYGFLSENAGVRPRLRARGIIFIGPSPELLENGRQDRGPRARPQVGVPTLPGTEEPVTDRTRR
jgi:acetyl/propionyl-CoA carboxylase alpha subunit